MEAMDYRIAWLVYVIAGIAIAVVIWNTLKKYFWREIAYLLESFLVVIIFTPWYVLAEEDVLAPAVIIFLMDTITIDAAAGVRALIPLVMGFMLAIIVTIILSVIYRIKKRKQDRAAIENKKKAGNKKMEDKKSVKAKESVIS